MTEVESVRPERCNILDIWDDMMRPFDDEEAKEDSRDAGVKEDVDDNQDRGSEVREKGDGDETISNDGEEGAIVKIGKIEKAPSKEEVAMHMVNHIPFRSWCAHCVKGKAHGNMHKSKKTIEVEEREPII